MNISLAGAGDEDGIAVAHVNAMQTAYRGIVADSFLDQLDVPERATRWAEILRDPACTLLVAKDGRQVIGFISFGKSREEDTGAWDAEIWTLYVDPASWRKGVGQALMGEALTELRRRGFSDVWVWVLQDNEQAVGFYSSNGFAARSGSQRRFKLGGQELSEVALVRRGA